MTNIINMDERTRIITNESYAIKHCKSVVVINPISYDTGTRLLESPSPNCVSIRLTRCNHILINRDDKVHIFISNEKAAATSSLGYIIGLLKSINVRNITIHVPRLYDWIFRLVNIAAANHKVRIVSERFVKPVEFLDSITFYRLYIENTSGTTDISHYGLYYNFAYVTYDYSNKSFVAYGRSYTYKERSTLLKGESQYEN